MTSADRAAWLDSPAVKEHLRPFLGWILERHAALGGATEIRIIGKPPRYGVWSGLFGPADLEAAIEALAPGGRGDHPRAGQANVYFSLQAVDPSAGVRGRIARARTAIKDRDVLAYTLLAIDVDPEREPKDVSATDAEKEQARLVADRIAAWLGERGVASIRADSGNGWHLLVPVRPVLGEAVGEAAKEAHRILAWLHQRFSTPGARVDTAVFNPSRIFKLYGTKAVKGTPTAERPHRDSAVDLVVPPDVDLFAILPREATAPSSTKPPEPADRDAAWKEWRTRALAALPLDRAYGEWLTGATRDGWLVCRDPSSPSGDRNPSAGVADGTGTAERGTFHSFRTGESASVFDFLVARGKASTFAAACVLVAEWSGVALPEASTTPDPILTRFRKAWTAATDDAERNAVLRDAVAQLLRLPSLEQRQGLDEVRRVSGVSPGAMRDTVNEVRRLARQRRSDPPRPAQERPVVDYVHNRDRVEQLFDALVAAVKPANRFFRNDREMVFVRRGIGPIPVTERNVSGLLSALAEIRFLVETDDGVSFQRFDVLPGDLARAFVASPRVHAQLPVLELYARAPLFDRDWNFVGRPGYHPSCGVFYDGPAVEPKAGVETLCEALRDFRWKGEADLVNFVGALLTALTMPQWGRGHPFLAVNGNKPGVGKSTLARVLGVLVEGSEPNTVSYVPDDAEFEKQLATRVEAGDRVIVIDNAKTRKPIESAVLERCITDSRINFRRLGSNSAISRPSNDILFCLTMNLTQMGADLRRRALPLNLEVGENVRAAGYAKDDLVGFVIEHRLAIVAELAGLVRAWLDAGRPECEAPARHSTSQRWAATIDAILRLGGFDGFLSNFEDSEHAFDARYQAMLEIATEHHAKSPATSARWTEWLDVTGGPLEDRFRDRRGQPKTPRAKATIVGSLFTDYLDARFKVNGRAYQLHRVFPDGETRSPTYAFREVTP